MTQQPSDQCPYERPFPRDFASCPAFHAVEYAPLTSRYDVLPPVWTCHNLLTARRSEGRRGFYAQCRLGDATARVAWVDRLPPHRLHQLAALRDGMSSATAAEALRLRELKAEQLRTPSGTAERDAVSRRLAAQGRRFMTAVEVYLEDNTEALSAVDFPLSACVDLVAEVIATWMASANAEVPELSEEVVARFPEGARIFLQPPRDPGHGSTTRAAVAPPPAPAH